MLAALCAVACTPAPPPVAPPSGPGVNVTSEPPGAQVSLDGRKLGRTTPAHLETGEAISAHELQIELPGYVPFRFQLPIGDPPAEVHAKLSQAAFVDVSSEPPGAHILIGKIPVADAPAKVAVPAGVPQQLSLTLDGYASQFTTLTVAVGETVPWHATLPHAGLADFQSDPPGALITLDGEKVGLTPLQLPVAADQAHHAKLTLGNLSPCSKTFKVPFAGHETVSCSLDDVVGRRLKDRLKVTDTRLEMLRKQLEHYESVDTHYVPEMSRLRSRNQIQDEIDKLSAEEDREQGDLDTHRTELQDQADRRGAEPRP
jgi:hypothetical protein